MHLPLAGVPGLLLSAEELHAANSLLAPEVVVAQRAFVVVRDPLVEALVVEKVLAGEHHNAVVFVVVAEANRAR